MLEEELETYGRKKPELLRTNEGKFVLIKGKEIINIFESQNDAIKTGIEKFGNTPFLVKKIETIELGQNFTSNLIRCNSLCLH